MKTSLTLRDRSLHLVRYPEHLQHVSWQAWDAADEYLIEYVESNVAGYQDKQIRIYNDDFGALSCWFAEAAPLYFSDSFVAHKSCLINLAKNQISQDKLRFYDSLQQVSEPVDLVLIKIPKTSALLEQQLIDLQSVVSTNTQVIAAGKANAIQKSTLSVFEKYLGTTTTSLARKKSRLIFCRPSADKHNKSPYPSVWHTESPRFEISNFANVFSRQQLDIGARLLLQHLPDVHNRTVIDLGCGNGVLGLHVLRQYPSAKVVFVDESHMALASARHNVQTNMPERLEQCTFLVNNCLDDFEQITGIQNVDMVLCNPPFHQQNTITDHIALQMFNDAKRVLKHNGELHVVGNRHLDYPAKLKRMFANYSVLASDRKFSILSCIKT